MTKNIVLTGLMGSGKTTLGKYLAQNTGMEFVDTDELIVQKAGKPISQIFADDGELYFRDLEAKTIEEASHKSGRIISTGGGAVLREENMANLKKTGIVFYLEAPAQILYDRVKDDTSRPLLKVDNPLEKLEQLLAQRRSHYETADFKVNTGGKSLEETSKLVLELYQTRSMHSA